MSELPENMVPRILQDIRRGLADQRSMLLLLVEQGQRHDRSIQEVRRDMRDIKRDIHEVKAELMGRMGNFESRLRISLTRAQRVRLSATVEALLHRWMQNEQEMWSLTDEDDDADDETELDGPMAGSA